jgi:hypothetical protein
VTQPDVAITDFLLALESVILAALLSSQPASRPDLQLCFVVFFLATGLAAALGGTVHGFLSAQPSRLRAVVWRSTLIAIGVAAASGWMIGAGMLRGDANPAWILGIVGAELVLYAVVVIVVSDAFGVAIANYLPSTVFLLFAYCVAYQSRPSGALAIGIAGFALTVAAALGQRLRLGIHPRYFDHNAVYHVVQGIALAMIFWSGRHLVGS